nr:YTH domain-containing protein [Tanacetum cinerariifolium]
MHTLDLTSFIHSHVVDSAKHNCRRDVVRQQKVEKSYYAKELEAKMTFELKALTEEVMELMNHIKNKRKTVEEKYVWAMVCGLRRKKQYNRNVERKEQEENACFITSRALALSLGLIKIRWFNSMIATCATDLLKNLSIDSQAKTLEAYEPTNKTSVNNVNGQVQSRNKAGAPLVSNYVDPSLAYWYDLFVYAMMEVPLIQRSIIGTFCSDDLAHGVYLYGYASYSPVGSSMPTVGQDAGSESRHPMLNKENYVPWSSRLLWYTKSRPNRKLIHDSILNGPYVRKIIPEPGDANRDITVTETFHLQTDDELSDKELKQIEADHQAIQTILLGLPEDIYAAERFTSNEGESIESYYHRFLKLMNDLKRNKHFPEKIASNLKFLNNLQPEWSRHVTIVHQTEDLHTADYTQLYDFLKYNQKEVDELKAERLAKTQDSLALMANSNNPYVFPAPHQDHSSFNQNYLQQPIPNPEDIIDPTTAINMALALMAKAFKLNYSTPTNNNQRISSNPRNRQIAQPGQNVGNLAGHNDIIGNQVIHNVGNQNDLIGFQGNGNQIGNGNLVAARHYARNCTIRPRRRDVAYPQTQLLIAQKEEAGIQLQAEEYDLMAAAADL